MAFFSEPHVTHEKHVALRNFKLGEIVDKIIKCFVMLVLLSVVSLPTVDIRAYSSSSRAVTVGGNLSTGGGDASTSLEGMANAIVIGVKSGLSGASKLADVVARFGGRIVNNVTVGSEPLAVVVDMPLGGVSLFEREAQASGLVRYIEPNVVFRAQFVPGDPYYPNQWALPTIKADWAWNTTTGNHSILVGVIDTGIDYNHPDLAPNYNASGYNWVDSDADPMDDNGHGTHVAGTIAAVLNNGQGIAGLAQVQVMAEKGLNASGYGNEVDLAHAIYDAVYKGAKILNLSWGSNEGSELIHEAIQYAYAHGVLIVAAAGNGGSAMRMYPAAYSEVIAVTATDQSDLPADFTSYGDWVELAAPGVSILSTLPTSHVVLNDPPYSKNLDYDYLSGTSMASPHVAGLGALIWSRFPNATRDWVRAQLRYTADDLGTPGFDQYYGYGRINAENAVEQAPPMHDVLIFNLEKPSGIQPGDVVVFNLTVLNFGTSDEQNVTGELFIDGNLQSSAQIGSLSAGLSWTTGFLWNPQAEGTFNITLYVVPVTGEANIDNNRLAEEVSVQQMLSLNPSQGPAGTKTVVIGVGFSPLSQIMVAFNDALVGFTATDVLGSFEFTFNVPFSDAGAQDVKASDSVGISASSVFTVVDTTPLVVQVDVGTIHFIQETADFFAQTTFKGQAVDATITQATLYKPDGSVENLAVQHVSTGLYEIPYTLVGNQTGTYTLVVEASYATNTIQANGTSFKSFLVSSTLTLMDQEVVDMNGSIARVQTDLGLIELNLTAMNAQVIDIKDGVANVQTDLGFVKLNLTSINATLDSIFLNVEAMNGSVATIETTIGAMKGTITSMNDNVATILVPGVGQIKADVSGFKETGVWTVTQYLILAIAAVAAVAAILTVLTLRRRKKSESTTNPQAPPPQVLS